MSGSCYRETLKHPGKEKLSSEAILHFGICLSGFRANMHAILPDFPSRSMKVSSGLSTSPHYYALVVAFENCKLPIEHQSLIGKHDKCLHHEHPVRQL